LLSTVPHLGHAVATLVGAYARSANIGFDWLAALIQRADDNEAWIGFAYQGSEEASWIKDNHPTKLPVVARAALITAPKKVIPKLLSNAIDDERPLNASPDHALRLISEWVLSGMPGTNEPVSRRRTLLQALLKWSDEPRKIDVTLKAFEYVMAPNFQEHSSDAGSGMRFRIRNAFLLKGELEQITEFWPKILQLLKANKIAQWKPITDLIAHDWIQARIRDQSDVIWRKEELVSSAISRLSRDQRTDILGIADQALGSAKLIRLLVGDDPHLA
jgi:hypothetical protein